MAESTPRNRLVRTREADHTAPSIAASRAYSAARTARTAAGSSESPASSMRMLEIVGDSTERMAGRARRLHINRVVHDDGHSTDWYLFRGVQVRLSQDPWRSG